MTRRGDVVGAPTLDRTAYGFLGTTCLSVIGSSFGLLGAAGAATAAGGIVDGGIFTSLFVSTMLLAQAISTPYGHLLAGRTGVRNAFAIAQATKALAFLLAGVALLAGLPTMPTLLIAAPVLGACDGVGSVVRTSVSKAYQSSDNTAHSYARLSVAMGIAGGIGGVAGGLALSHIAFGWGLVIVAPLAIPLIAFVARVAPKTDLPTPQSTQHPWSSAWHGLATNRLLRLSVILGASSIAFLGPVIALVVPIADGLRQDPAVGAAGLLMASFAAGEMAAPWAVRFAQRRATDLLAGEVAGALAGALLIVLGAISVVLTQRIELLVWIMIAVPFGVLRFTARALYIGSVADSGPDATANLASANMVVVLAAPIGTMAFGIGLGHGAVYTTLFVSGACAIALNLVTVWRLRTSARRDLGEVARRTPGGATDTAEPRTHRRPQQAVGSEPSPAPTGADHRSRLSPGSRSA